MKVQDMTECGYEDMTECGYEEFNVIQLPRHFCQNWSYHNFLSCIHKYNGQNKRIQSQLSLNCLNINTCTFLISCNCCEIFCFLEHIIWFIFCFLEHIISFMNKFEKFPNAQKPSENFWWRRWGSLLLCLYTRGTPLGPPSTTAEFFWCRSWQNKT